MKSVALDVVSGWAWRCEMNMDRGELARVARAIIDVVGLEVALEGGSNKQVLDALVQRDGGFDDIKEVYLEETSRGNLHRLRQDVPLRHQAEDSMKPELIPGWNRRTYRITNNTYAVKAGRGWVVFWRNEHANQWQTDAGDLGRFFSSYRDDVVRYAIRFGKRYASLKAAQDAHHHDDYVAF